MNQEEFFAGLMGRTNGYLEIRLVPPIRGQEDAIKKFFRLPEGIPAAARFAADHDGQAHVFFGVLPRSGLRGTADGVSAVPCLFADIDAKDFAGGEDQVIRKFEALKEVGYPPSILVRSGGGGRHGYWFLDPPVQVTGETARNQVRAAIWAIADALGVPPRVNVVHDLARLLRVPGTHNIKPQYPRPQLCEIDVVTGNRYGFGEFAPLVRAHQRPVQQQTQRRWGGFVGNYPMPADPEELLKELDVSRPMLKLCREGVPEGQDRSAMCQKVIVALLRAGADQDRIRAVFSHPSFGIGAKYREHLQPDHWLGYSISRAEAFIADHPAPIHEEGGFKFFLPKEPCGPPRLQVSKAGGVARVTLEPAVKLDQAPGLTDTEKHSILRIVQKHQERFKLKWDEAKARTQASQGRLQQPKAYSR